MSDHHFETELVINGRKVKALVEGYFTIGDDGKIEDIWLGTFERYQFQHLDGALYEIVKATLEVDYADVIADANEASKPPVRPYTAPIYI